MCVCSILLSFPLRTLRPLLPTDGWLLGVIHLLPDYGIALPNTHRATYVLL